MVFGCFRNTKLEQRMKHEALYAGRAVVVSPGATYYLVPSLWLTRWKAYLTASGKNLLDVDEPDGLEGLILSLLCSKVIILSLYSTDYIVAAVGTTWHIVWFLLLTVFSFTYTVLYSPSCSCQRELVCYLLLPGSVICGPFLQHERMLFKPPPLTISRRGELTQSTGTVSH
jgi:hypothetical protein